MLCRCRPTLRSERPNALVVVTSLLPMLCRQQHAYVAVADSACAHEEDAHTLLLLQSAPPRARWAHAHAGSLLICSRYCCCCCCCCCRHAESTHAGSCLAHTRSLPLLFKQQQHAHHQPAVLLAVVADTHAEYTHTRCRNARLLARGITLRMAPRCAAVELLRAALKL